MRTDEFHAGAHWAYREGRALGTPATKVQLVMWVPAKPPSRKSPQVKIRHLEGDLAGMEEFVPPVRLVCPWKAWPRLLRAEQAEVALQESLVDADLDKALIGAANAAFGASGEDIYLEDFRGYVRNESVEALERVARRAGWSSERAPWRQRPNFVGIGGGAYVAHHHLIELARDFATHEPDAVTLYVDAEEAKYRERGFRGERFFHDLLLEQGPAHSIVRDWAGTTSRTSLAKEVQDLRALLYEALNALRKAGATKEADAIERRFNRHTAPDWR